MFYPSCGIQHHPYKDNLFPWICIVFIWRFYFSIIFIGHLEFRCLIQRNHKRLFVSLVIVNHNALKHFITGQNAFLINERRSTFCEFWGGSGRKECSRFSFFYISVIPEGKITHHEANKRQFSMSIAHSTLSFSSNHIATNGGSAVLWKKFSQKKNQEFMNGKIRFPKKYLINLVINNRFILSYLKFGVSTILQPLARVV